jgi:hypothetical protein
MKFTTPARRLLAAGAVSALAAGTLVGMTTTASAAPINNQYTCQSTTPGETFPLWLTSDIPGLEEYPEAPAGFLVPPILTVVNTVTVPAEVIQTMEGFNIDRLESPDFAGSIGDTVVGVDDVGALVADATDNGNGTYSFPADGINAPFEVPAAGTYDVVGPEAFHIDAYAGDFPVLSVPCELTDGTTNGVYQSVTVLKNESTSNAKPTKRQFKKSAPNETPSGKVLLKKGTKTLAKGNLNDNGVVVLKTKALRVGKTKLKTVYKGDGYTKPSTDTVVVKVVR